MNTKVCTKCDTEKSLDAFHRNASSKDRLQSVCRACRSAYAAVRNTLPEVRAKCLASTAAYRATLKGRETNHECSRRYGEVGRQRRTEYLQARCQLRSELSGTAVEDASDLLLHHWQPNEKSMNCAYPAFAKDPAAATREADLYCVAILRSEHLREHRAWERGETLLAHLRPDAQPWVKDSNGEWVPYEQEVAA